LREPPYQLLNDVKCFIPKPIAIDDFVKKVKEEISTKYIIVPERE
jgi:hypothetical protein